MSINRPDWGPPHALPPTDSGGQRPGVDTAPAEPVSPASTVTPAAPDALLAPAAAPREIGGPPGPEPTRYGDWQFNGRVTDF